jgi:predicted small secreted protein
VINDNQEPMIVGSKRFFIGVGVGMTFVILLLAYFLYKQYKQNQRL